MNLKTTKRNQCAVCFTTWRPDHNNTRYASIFPYLTPEIDFHTFHFSKQRLIRAGQGRLWNAAQDSIIYPTLLPLFNRRHENLYTIDFRQIPYWHGRVIIDIDDPEFTTEEIRCLNLPNVAAIIVTTNRIKAILLERGITRKICVIPQGVSRTRLNADRVLEIKAKYKQDNLVVGYHSPRLTLASDGAARAKQGLNDLDILVNAVEAARKIDSRVVLWLIGHPSAELQRYAENASWVRLFGYIPFEDTLHFVENFDIGTYPRTIQLPLGRFSVKLAQYMACGVPIVSTGVDESFIVAEAKAGIITHSAQEFSGAVCDLVESARLRRELGDAGAKFAFENLEWEILVPKYRKILEDSFGKELMN